MALLVSSPCQTTAAAGSPHMDPNEQVREHQALEHGALEAAIPPMPDPEAASLKEAQAGLAALGDELRLGNAATVSLSHCLRPSPGLQRSRRPSGAVSPVPSYDAGTAHECPCR